METRGDPAPPARGERRAQAPLVALALALAVVPFFLRWPLLHSRGFNPDELEHLHFSWCVAQGKVPYVDYFDHHTPWLHLALARLVSRFDTAASEDEAVAALFAARAAMLPWAALTLGLTAVLAGRVAGGAAAWLAPVLLTHFAYFLSKGLEVRPDGPAAALLLAGVILVRGADPGWARRRRAAFLASGLLFGAASLVTQKALFGLVGVALAELAGLAVGGGRRRARTGDVAAQAAGFALPWAGTLLFFARRGAVRAFIDANFVLNTRWPGPGASGFLHEIVGDDPALVAVSLVGLAALVAALVRGRGRPEGEMVTVATPIALVLGLAVLPAVTRHYFLLVLPFLAVAAAAFLVRAAQRLPVSRTAAYGILAVVVALACLKPLGRLRESFDRGNWSTLQGIRWVVRNVGAGETTLDGYSGLGVFRPQPFFHQFFYADPRAIQTESQQREVLDGLRSGRALPKAVFLDWRLRSGVQPEVIEFVERHYARLGPEPIRVRVFDNGLGFWTDEGPRWMAWAPGRERAPHVFFESGWRSPAPVDGIAARRTRTGRSILVVPIQKPRDYAVRLRARSVAALAIFDFEMVANGRSAGTSTASPRWQDHLFAFEGRHLVPGFNQVELRMPPSAEGRAELAIESLALERR
jgi:hypothetical protein